jgi:hypothetical protein
MEATGPARAERIRELSNKIVTNAVTAGASAGVTDVVQHLLPHLTRVLTTLSGGSFPAEEHFQGRAGQMAP